MSALEQEQPISQEQAPSIQRPMLSNFQIRYITALVFLPVVLATLYLGGVWWGIMVSIMALLGTLEFFMLAKGRSIQGSAATGIPMMLGVLAAFAFRQPLAAVVTLTAGIIITFLLETVRQPGDVRRTLLQVVTTLAGVLYVGFPSGFLLDLRARETGLVLIVLVLATTWGTDTFAYFGGRYFGKTKLVPRLSPNKTVEGAVAGVIGGFLLALLFLLASEHFTLPLLVIIALAPLAAVAGDLLESAIKRFFNVKDSHIAGLNIFPGHGGVLDRVDSLLVVASLFYIALAIVP